MTSAQIELYKKLKNKLYNRGYVIPSLNNSIKEIKNPEAFILIKDLTDNLKNIDAWENDYNYREECYLTFGSSYNHRSQTIKELRFIFIKAKYMGKTETIK